MPTHPEQLLISAVLRTGNVKDAVSFGCSSLWFTVYRDEWKYIERIYNKHKHAPDKPTFKQQFPDFRVIATDDIETALDKIRESYIRQSILQMTEKIIDGLDEGSDLHDVISKAQVGLTKVERDLSGEDYESDIIKNWRPIYEEVLRRKEATDQGISPGVPVGFTTLDMISGGAQPGESWVLAGRMGQGKTWLLLHMACSALWTDHPVLYFSLEMRRIQLGLRAHAFMSSKNGEKTFKALDLKHGKNFDTSEYRSWLRKMKSGSGTPFVINDTPRGKLTPLSIRASIEQNEPKIVFLDYLGLMSRPGEWSQLADLSGEIKGIASEYGVPIVTAAQLNRLGEGAREITMSMLSGSDNIGMDADAVITLQRVSKRVRKMKLLKYRDGEDNKSWYVKFLPNTGHIEEISGDQAQVLIDEDEDSEDD